MTDDEKAMLRKTDPESLRYFKDIDINRIDVNDLPQEFDWSNIHGVSYVPNPKS